MNQRLLLTATGLGALLLPLSCGGSGGGGSSSAMVLEEVNTGFGRLLPYVVFELDDQGQPTGDLIELREIEDLLANVTPTNPIQSIKEWPTTAELPTGSSGNHYIHARFRQPIDADSVLNAAAAAASSSHLIGTVTMIAINPVTGATTQIPGRAFIGGRTYGNTPDPEDPTKRLLETWVTASGGLVTAVDVGGTFPGLGFPGTQTDFAGAVELVDPRSFVFVPDTDGNLATHETFPANVQIRLQMTEGVLGTNGKALEDQAVASSTVGVDTVPPEVKVAGSDQTPVIIPGNGDVDVDPQTTITVEFTEPVQIPTIGSLPSSSPPTLASSILVQFGPSTSVTTVPYTVMPRSVFDLTSMVLTPTYAFPGAGPEFEDCGAFNQVTVLVNQQQFQDLAGNLNNGTPITNFSTGAGPGLVNAPVTPDVIYASRVEQDASLSVIDLNGFGATTGNPTYDPLCPIKKGNSNFPNNPNVQLQGSAISPKLTAGSCTFNGGSAGPFSLTLDSALNSRLVTTPMIESVNDMMLGHALDNVYNDGAPFGCQSGGGNFCAATGLKQVLLGVAGTSTVVPAGTLIGPIKLVSGLENLASWAPHPNPPPLVFPPLCLSPSVGGQEPTSQLMTDLLVPKNNLLVPGTIPLGNPATCQPPKNLLTPDQNSFFNGPYPQSTDVANCSVYAYRQQIGHFLYVADRVASEVVVLNSNRMTVLDRIPVPDPTALAMSPDLDFLAVTNQNADSVSFISTDPVSSTFHQVVKTTKVGKGPTGIAWESGNEDILVCNTGDNTVTMISAFTLNIRKTLSNQLFGPIDVVTTPRQLGFGLFRGVYYAYILNSNGTVSLFESGPDGVNGWGYDEIIGQPQFHFQNPKAIQPDVTNLNSAIWVAHEVALDFDGTPLAIDGGALTNLVIEAGFIGIVPLDPGFFADPSLRDLSFAINGSISEGEGGLTGVPTDIAFDNHRNMSALTNFSTNFSAGFPLGLNGKSIVKPLGVGFVPVNSPQFLFAAVPTSDEGPGVVDVIFLEGGFQRFDTDIFQPGVQSIPMPGVRHVMDYFRQ
jgi:DNA-binding beta-propeller fold protein YncE